MGRRACRGCPLKPKTTLHLCAAQIAAGAVSLILSGCLYSTGVPARSFVNQDVARAYIPLGNITYYLEKHSGAAFVVAPGIAVTNAHNADYLDADFAVIGKSHDYDLLYFRVGAAVPPVFGAPSVGERVIAYGQGELDDVREAVGVVRQLNVPVEPRCETCMTQSAFTFEGNAGPGFSGGPVVDAKSGAIVGVTFGYVDQDGHRLMYAYPMSRVRNELAAVRGQVPAIVN